MNVVYNLTSQEREQLVNDFNKYEKYIYSILGTPSHHSSTRTPKVNIYNAQALSMTDEDLFQQGRVYLWEALLNYGRKKPMRGGKMASKSTFVFQHIKYEFINLGIKCTCKKYQGINVEIEKGYDISDSKEIDQHLVNTEVEKVLEDCKKYKRSEPTKYKQLLTNYWKGQNVG